MKGEYIYHLDGNLANDDINNLKVIDDRPIDIEVKHPYDPVRYYGRRSLDKRKRTYIVRLYLKKEYRNENTLEEEKIITKPINIYIGETEIENRFLDDDECVIFKDGDKTNYNVNNLEVIKGIYSKHPQAKIPYQDYRIGTEDKNQSGNIGINLYHIKNKNTRLFLIRSKYKYCVKLGRKLERNEYLVYKDGNHLNHDIDNLTHGTYKQAEYPFDDYYEGIIYEHNTDGRKVINLLHKTDSKKNIPGMKYARYRMQVILGRLLTKDEEVDHIDSNSQNDSDDNLQVLTIEKHKNKSAQDKKDMIPKIETYCDGCNKEFESHLSYIRQQLNQETNKFNNFFCSWPCRSKYIQDGNNIKHKKLIKYICTGSGQEIWIPENARFLPSRLNPDALPFYDVYNVSKWIRKNNKSANSIP